MTEYEQLSAAIESRIASDPQLRALRKKISQGTATLAESSKYSQLCAQIMGQKLSGQVLGLSDREGVCTQLLHDRYSDVNQVCEQVMRSIDERAGIAMNPRHAAFPAERVQQLAHSLTDPTVPDETIQRRANTGAANVAISFHDDFVDENASFRSDAGYECYITRVVGGASCPWCSAMAGRYKYPDETPDDIFRRHDNCTCTVTFEQGRFRQDVWSKRSWEAPKTGAGAPPPKVFSQEEADRLEQERLSEYRGLTSGGESGIIESERQVSSDRYSVPKGLTESRAFRSKFNEMTDDPSLQREYYQAAKEILSHRSGNNGEDLYFYNIKSGNWTKSTSGTTAGSPEYTPEIVKAIEKSDIGDLVAFHNHPAGMPPSAGDFNAAYENGYKVGYTIGHNGRIFEYTAPKEKIPEGIYNLRIAKYKSEKLSEYEAQLRTLEDLKSLFGFEFREVIGDER